MRIGRLALVSLAALGAACAAKARPEHLGVTNGALASCASGPHCVSTQAQGGRAVEPIRYQGSRDEARRRLVSVLRSMPRSTVVVEAPDYVRAEFRSKTFGYVDDFEAHLVDREKSIEMRSASREGWWDFGVNRGRVEEIREKFLAGSPPAPAPTAGPSPKATPARKKRPPKKAAARPAPTATPLLRGGDAPVAEATPRPR